LIRLDGAAIDPDGSYGPATAAAVLAYKQKRKIINFSYQTTADNIVGKMTMAALDKEMLAAELKPIFLVPKHPLPRLAVSLPRETAFFSVNGISSGPFRVVDLRPVPVPPPQTPGPGIAQVEVIILRGTIGTIRILGGSGGSVVRSQLIHFYGASKNPEQVAELRGAKQKNKDFEEVDILTDDVTVTFDAVNCGETFFQARISPPQPPQKLSNILRVLSLVDRSVTLPVPSGDYSPDPNFPSGLVSKEGTPLNPRPGRKINIFGEGESAGFEDYSSDIDFCTHTFSLGQGPPGATRGHRPWTTDPRRPPGLPDKSVDNICSRGSPIHPVTIKEILRIGASGCPVTCSDAGGRVQCDRMKAGLPRAKVIEEGNRTDGGRSIVLELP
jgi:hypothetical protein